MTENEPIREFTEEDRARVKEIYLTQSVRVHAFVDQDPLRFWRGKCKGLWPTPPEKNMYVYESSGVVKGFVVFGKTSQYPYYIFELFVDIASAGKGIGTKLLKYAIAEMHKPPTLHVYLGNSESVRWYIRRGFQPVKLHDEQETGQLKLVIKWPPTAAPQPETP